MPLDRQCKQPMEETRKCQPNTTLQPSNQCSSQFQESRLGGDQGGPTLQASAPTFPAIQLNRGHGIPVEGEPSIIFIPQEPPPPSPLSYSNLKPILMSEECIVMQPGRVKPYAAEAYNYSSNNEAQNSRPAPQDFSATHNGNRRTVSVPPTVIVVSDHGDRCSHETSKLVQPQVIPSPPPLKKISDSSSERLSQLNVAQHSSSQGQSLNHQQNIQAKYSDTSMEPAALTNRSPQPNDESSTAKPIQEILTETPLANANPAKAAVSIQGRYHNMLANRAANLANLLPTGTVLMFQSLIPSLSNNGKCQLVNKVFIGSTIFVCALACILSSFTDSFYVEMATAKLNKLYYGFATPKGLCIFNYDNREEEEVLIRKYLPAYKIRRRDYVHAFGSLIIFLVFAASSREVVSCYFPDAGESVLAVIGYLPLVAGVLGSCLFSISPTKRKGIGYGDSTVNRVSA